MGTGHAYTLTFKYASSQEEVTAERVLVTRPGFKFTSWNEDPNGMGAVRYPGEKSVPLFREYNPNAFSNNHNYTTDESGHQYLLSLGWHDEGYAWYSLY